MKSFTRSKAALFTSARYVGYALQLARGIILARILEPTLFGVFGFLILVQTYLTYGNLGIPYAINLDLASGKTRYGEPESLISYAFTLTLFVAVLITAMGGVIWAFRIPLFAKYEFTPYALLVAATGAFGILREFFSDIYQVYGQLGRIIAYELNSNVMLFLTCFFFAARQQIEAQFAVAVLAGLAGTTIFLYRHPFEIGIKFDFAKSKHILSTGLPLLASTVTFYLILMSSRTIISAYYPLEVMGYYSLANSIASVTLLGLNAISWVFYPSIISKITRDQEAGDAASIVHKVNTLYNMSVWTIVLSVIPCIPIMVLVLPKYGPAEPLIALLLISQAVVSAGFGFSTLANARRRQMQVAKFSFFALVVVLILSLLLGITEMDPRWIASVTVLGFLAYDVLLVRFGCSLLGVPFHRILFSEVFPPGVVLALLLVAAGSFLGSLMWVGLLALVIFVILERRKLYFVLQTTFNIV